MVRLGFEKWRAILLERGQEMFSIMEQKEKKGSFLLQPKHSCYGYEGTCINTDWLHV